MGSTMDNFVRYSTPIVIRDSSSYWYPNGSVGDNDNLFLTNGATDNDWVDALSIIIRDPYSHGSTRIVKSGDTVELIVKTKGKTYYITTGGNNAPPQTVDSGLNAIGRRTQSQWRLGTSSGSLLQFNQSVSIYNQHAQNYLIHGSEGITTAQQSSLAWQIMPEHSAQASAKIASCSVCADCDSRFNVSLGMCEGTAFTETPKGLPSFTVTPYYSATRLPTTKAGQTVCCCSAPCGGSSGTKCSTANDCPNNAPYCVQGACVQCRSDSDCSGGETCAQGVCSGGTSYALYVGVGVGVLLIIVLLIAALRK